MRAIPSIIALGTALTLALAVLNLVGCSDKPRFAFEGQWIGQQKIDAVPGANPDVVNTLSEVKVIFQPNNRFDMLYRGMPISGEVSIDGNQATLQVTSTLDRALNRDRDRLEKMYPAMKLRGRADGTITFTDPHGPDPTPVQLIRIATDARSRP
ncbi:MAG: hypothetical protein P4L46_04230 [Fimbriimonas sp.]|nr:hypothetical protein [Fimbriimonas sp.]